MKKVDDPAVLDECDFSGGIRGKYAARFSQGINAVVLDPDVAVHFPDGEAVNNALHLVAAFENQRKR